MVLPNLESTTIHFRYPYLLLPIPSVQLRCQLDQHHTFWIRSFNILFYHNDTGALYYIYDQVQAFFKDVWQTPNQLLCAVN